MIFQCDEIVNKLDLMDRVTTTSEQEAFFSMLTVAVQART